MAYLPHASANPTSRVGPPFFVKGTAETVALRNDGDMLRNTSIVRYLTKKNEKRGAQGPAAVSPRRETSHQRFLVYREDALCFFSTRETVSLFKGSGSSRRPSRGSSSRYSSVEEYTIRVFYQKSLARGPSSEFPRWVSRAQCSNFVTEPTQLVFYHPSTAEQKLPTRIVGSLTRHAQEFSRHD